MTLFDETAAALVQAIVAAHDRDRAGLPPGSRERIAEFVRGQVAHMASPLRQPVRVATCGLSLLALVSTGRPLHRLPVDRRRALVERWRRSAVGPIRDVVRLYESLAVFALHSTEGI